MASAVSAARGEFDHRAYRVLHAHTVLYEDRLGHATHDLLLVLVFGGERNQRNHDFGKHHHSAFGTSDCGCRNRPNLHLGHLRIRNPQATTPMAEHRIGLRQPLDLGQDRLSFVDLIEKSVDVIQALRMPEDAA